MQVNTRKGAAGAAATPPAAGGSCAADEADSRPTWRQRLRALLCCLNPEAADQYYRSGESESVVVRPPVHPPPPLYSAAPVIGPLQARDAGKKTLVLDLDETLVHSSFKPISNPDYIIPVRPPARLPAPACSVTPVLNGQPPARTHQLGCLK